MPAPESVRRSIDHEEWVERNAEVAWTWEEEMAYEDARQDRLFEKSDWRVHEIWGL